MVSCQVDNLAEPKTVEVVAEDYGVSPAKVHRAFQFVKVLREIGKAYDRRQKGHGGDHNPEGTNQYTIERSSYQVENLTEPKTVEVVAEDYGVSPAKVHRAFEFVKVRGEMGKADARQ